MPVLLALLLSLGFAPASPSAELPPALAREKMDSLRRHLETRIFSAPEQQEWRQCMTGKRKFLETGRKADRSFAEVDSLLKVSKLAHRDPGDPDVARLLEKKFLLENGLEQRWLVSARGKSCGKTEADRFHRLENSLKKNPEYQNWKKQSETPVKPIGKRA